VWRNALLREIPKASTTTLNLKLLKGTRLIVEPNGNNVEDTTMDNPQCYHLNPIRQGYDEHSETERVLVINDGLIILKWLKIQSGF